MVSSFFLSFLLSFFLWRAMGMECDGKGGEGGYLVFGVFPILEMGASSCATQVSIRCVSLEKNSSTLPTPSTPPTPFGPADRRADT
ncbi:hypothetical protein K505DRAFT_321722 [Melanomma pulvis-pyrius CBS 109.77]|uniref:Secreted protein n=1 Tax=Melanomma pulvis-pyrius CBS 109.77 TaxID=1314802 RepID=A0A6A6XQK6_9PLEO|nr:hypothetical protein K505DRAFT_321722 [Melanomma pulvis-pyrius CBS 109.77]